jgi:predicted DNA-binding protein
MGKVIQSFKIDEELLNKMFIASQKLGITKSELIRRAIVYYLIAMNMNEVMHLDA